MLRGVKTPGGESGHAPRRRAAEARSHGRLRQLQDPHARGSDEQANVAGSVASKS